jgi:hypothetical protein
MTHPWLPLYSHNNIANQTVWGIYGPVGFLQTRISPQSNYLTSGTNRNMLNGATAGIKKTRVCEYSSAASEYLRRLYQRQRQRKNPAVVGFSALFGSATKLMLSLFRPRHRRQIMEGYDWMAGIVLHYVLQFLFRITNRGASTFELGCFRFRPPPF